MATVDTLLRQLTSGDYYERSNAARALGDADDPRVDDALIGALRDEDGWVVEYAAEALGRRGVTAAMTALLSLLEHERYQVRTAVAAALGNLRSTEALEALRAAADDPDPWVRDAVAKAIADIESGTPPPTRATFASCAAARETAPSVGPIPRVEPGPPPTPHAAPSVDVNKLMPDAAARACAQHKRLKDGSHLLRVTLATGRTQKVRVITGEETSHGERRVRFLTILGPATPKYAEWAMRQNLRITRGAMGLLTLQDRDYLALTETILEKDASLGCLVETIERVARRGDRLEGLLTEEDTW